MLPARQIDTVTREKSGEMAWDTLERLFMEMPQEFQDYLMEQFAKRSGGMTPDEPSMMGMMSGPPEPSKMAQMQNLKGKLGQY